MLGQTAGLSAGVDLALSLIEKDIGPDVPAWSASRWSPIIAVLVISRSIRRCWNSMPSPSAERARVSASASSKTPADVMHEVRRAPAAADPYTSARRYAPASLQEMVSPPRQQFRGRGPGGMIPRHPDGLRHGGATQTPIAGSIAARPPVLRLIICRLRVCRPK